MTRDYLIYYNLEKYLTKEVCRRFRRQRKLDAFDLWSIFIWKANRSKSRIAKRLIKKSGSIEKAATEFTSALFKATSAQERFRVATKEWGFALPMSSAILTILWPKEFTVFDIRVSEELNFQTLKGERLWAKYSRYKKAVESAAPPHLSLRDKDRYLWGRSAVKQLETDVASAFPSKRR